MSARPFKGADFNAPHLVADVHRMVNEHRKNVGLPEWDFSRSPQEQWWKKIPTAAALVKQKLKNIPKQSLWMLWRQRNMSKNYKGKSKAAVSKTL